MSVPWLVYECAMTHSMRTYSTHKYDIHQECDVSHLWVHHDSFVRVPWLILCAHAVLTSVTYIRSATWIIYACAMTHSWVCHDSLYACIQYSQAWHGSYIRSATWVIYECAMTHSWVCHDREYEYDMSHSYVTNSWVSILLRIFTRKQAAFDFWKFVLLRTLTFQNLHQQARPKRQHFNLLRIPTFDNLFCTFENFHYWEFILYFWEFLPASPSQKAASAKNPGQCS